MNPICKNLNEHKFQKRMHGGVHRQSYSRLSKFSLLPGMPLGGYNSLSSSAKTLPETRCLAVNRNATRAVVSTMPTMSTASAALLTELVDTLKSETSPSGGVKPGATMAEFGDAGKQKGTQATANQPSARQPKSRVLGLKEWGCKYGSGEPGPRSTLGVGFVRLRRSWTDVPSRDSGPSFPFFASGALLQRS